MHIHSNNGDTLKNPVSSFPFVADEHTEVLILGSMPGVKSLLEQQYYAHPRNAFWPIVEALFILDNDKSMPLSYQKRLQVLQKNRVALWDVLAQCERKGSLDSAIVNKSIFLNDFTSLFTYAPEIKTILFNGKTASKLFRQHAITQNADLFTDFQLIDLPSTSPANARMRFDEKLAAWQILKKITK